jgi:hypothetical protein
MTDGHYISIITCVLSLKAQGLTYIATMNMATNGYLPLRVSSLRDGVPAMLFSSTYLPEASYQMVFVQDKYHISCGSNMPDESFERIIQDFLVIE